MKDEITSIQWLGFALTEAIVFYAFIFGLIAFSSRPMAIATTIAPAVLAAAEGAGGESEGGSFLVTPTSG